MQLNGNECLSRYKNIVCPIHTISDLCWPHLKSYPFSVGEASTRQEVLWAEYLKASNDVMKLGFTLEKIKQERNLTSQQIGDFVDIDVEITTTYNKLLHTYAEAFSFHYKMHLEANIYEEESYFVQDIPYSILHNTTLRAAVEEYNYSVDAVICNNPLETGAGHFAVKKKVKELRQDFLTTAEKELKRLKSKPSKFSLKNLDKTVYVDWLPSPEERGEETVLLESFIEWLKYAGDNGSIIKAYSSYQEMTFNESLDELFLTLGLSCPE